MEEVHFSRGLWPKVFGLCFLTTSLYVSAEGWVIEVVDLERSYDVSIATDSTSHPHIAYSGGGSKARYLKYARRDSSGWMIETVDSSADVAYVSLSLNKSDTPHIGYYDVAGGDLKYARRDTTGWFIESVDTGGVVGNYASIGITSAGYPGISYYDQTSGDLKYAASAGEHWIIERVDTAGNVGSSSSLAVDQTDNPHISYYDRTNYCLKYAKKGEFGWSVTVVDSPRETYQRIGTQTSLAVDRLGYPHISYHYWERTALWDNGVRYAKWDGSEWHLKNVNWGCDDVTVGVSTSIDLDSGDYPCIAYVISDRDFPHGIYATWNGERWTGEMIDSSPWSDDISLSLDVTYNPHIAYCAEDTFPLSRDVLKHATRPTAVREDENTDPSRRVILEQPYPNPFSSETAIRYGLPDETRVSLKVYSLLGQEIRLLVDEWQNRGLHAVIWDGRDDFGRKISGGPYFLKLEVSSPYPFRIAVEKFTATRKLCVVR